MASRPVTVDIPHKLGRAEARRRIENGFGSMRNQLSGGGVKAMLMSFDERWEGDRLYFQGSGLGQKIWGHLDVFEDRVHMEIELPGFLAAIAGKITGRLRSEGQKLLTRG